MTHRDKSAVRGLIEELLAGGGDVDHADAMRRLLQAGLQELIEAEVAARIGAGRYERSEQRSTHRNGVRAKQLATPAGQVELAIPKLREGSFFPSLLEPRRRIDQALWAVIAQAWIQGVSTRRVDQLVKALGNEAGISRSQVSRICAEIDEYVAVFLTRRLDENDTWYPYLWLDATSTSGWAQGSRPKPSWSPPPARLPGAAKFSAWRSATQKPPTSGPSSSAPSANAGSRSPPALTGVGWCWSSPMPTPG